MFSGKGIFDDGTEGSPLIINKLLKEVENNSKVKIKKIYPAFIDKKYAKELEQNLNDKSCKVFQDNYKTKALDIIKKADNFNVFLYVDPFSIKDLDFEIFNELSKNQNSVELLLNLNSFGFIREGCRLLNAPIDDLAEFAGDYEEDSNFNSIENMNKIANGTEWQKIIETKKSGDIDGKQAEKYFTSLYMQKLGQIFNFVFSIPVTTGDNIVPKYVMVYATNHIQGALLMADNMVKCNQEMSLDNKKGQQSFFDYDYTKNNINEDILNALDTEMLNAKTLCLKLYSQSKFYLHSDIKKALKELEDSSKIIIDRLGALTPTGKKYSGFDFINKDIFVGRVI